MSRRAKIEIDLTQLRTLDAFGLGEALQSLPMDTKVISFGCEMTRAVLSILIENPIFRDLGELDMYPILNIRKMNDEKLFIDCHHCIFDDSFNPGPALYWNSEGTLSIREGFEFVSSGTIKTEFINETGEEIIKVTKFNSELNSIYTLESNKPCPHTSIKSYVGLTDSYNYCETCDEKLL